MFSVGTADTHLPASCWLKITPVEGIGTWSNVYGNQSREKGREGDGARPMLEIHSAPDAHWIGEDQGWSAAHVRVALTWMDELMPHSSWSRPQLISQHTES